MGKLSDIYTSYRKSLDRAQDDYEGVIKTRSVAVKTFYNAFFKDLVVNLGDRFTDEAYKDRVIDEIESFFGKTDLNFIAVDGSCHKHSSTEFISFYGGAYGAKGTISLWESPPKVEYKRWEIEKDVSMVAFIPIPYSRITEVEPKYTKEEVFAVSENDKIELSSIHLPVMQLAEVFLAYNTRVLDFLDGRCRE